MLPPPQKKPLFLQDYQHLNALLLQFLSVLGAKSFLKPSHIYSQFSLRYLSFHFHLHFIHLFFIDQNKYFRDFVEYT